MSTLALLFGMVACMALTWAIAYEARLPQSLRRRACQGRAWRKAFPAAHKEEIRRFLRVFASAFSFKPADMLKFHPDDRPLEVYRLLYPRAWTPDSLELETLASAIEAEYQLDFDSLWRPSLTLGQVFAAAQRHGTP